MKTRIPYLAILGAATLVATPGPSFAALITVSGGFTAFHTDFVFSNTSSFTQTLNGAQLCADAGCDVNGPANVAFANPESRVAFQNGDFLGLNAENAVSFTAAAGTDVFALGQPFLLGYISYENGIWSSTTLGTTFDFKLTTHAEPSSPFDPTAALFDNQVLTDTFQLTITPNDFTFGTPDGNADFISSLGYPLIGDLKAYELQDSPLSGPNPNVVTAELWGYLGSLHLDSFRNAIGGGFIGSTTPPAPVPEPMSLSLLLSGLGVLASTRLRRRKRS